MKAGRYFDLVRALPMCDWRAITNEKPFVVISPHPDDESLGTGGLIALARRHHQDATVVLVTDGAGSHPNSRSYPRERLIATRRSEMRQAAQVLGLSCDQIYELDFPDTTAPLAGPDFDTAVLTISNIVAATRAQSLFVTWRFDPHCDHEAAAALAEAVRKRRPYLALWAYPVWGWHLDPSTRIPVQVPEGARLAVAEVLEQKRAAIRAHVSQMTGLISDDPNGFCFTETTLAPFLLPYEYFIRV